ncbi:hypothetical protein LBMAG20_16290 [Methylocystaceae bacterium]|jgi:hypothetical protein|nr:hypothetical protein LBMAG20_16290 [Methylocystaceae bacterium]
MTGLAHCAIDGVDAVTGAGGRSRTGTGLSALRIFIPATTFVALRAQVWGLDYTFAIAG